MKFKYDVTLEEAYEKIAELKLLLKKAETAASHHVKLEALLNILSGQETVYIHIRNYRDASVNTDIIINPFNDFRDNEDVMKYKDRYVWAMWPCEEDAIKVLIMN